MTDKKYIWDGWQSDDDIPATNRSIAKAPTMSSGMSKSGPADILEQELDRKLQAAATELDAGSSSIFSSLNTVESETQYSGSLSMYSSVKGTPQQGSLLRSYDDSVNGTMKSVVSEIARKVQRMRNELQKRVQSARELSSELNRLQAATERRKSKARASWETQLQAVKTDHSEVRLRLQSFCDRLQQDNDKLRNQQKALETRIERGRQERQLALRRADAEIAKRLQRAKRQWETDERLSCEKVLRGKSEALQHQAAASFGPKLDQLVADGKQKVEDRREAGRVSVEKQRLTLEQRVEQRLAEEKERLQALAQTELQRGRERIQRRQAERQRSWEQELCALQEQQAKEKNSLEQSIGHTQQLEEQQSQEALQSMSKQESQQVVELVEKQQREVEFLMQQQHREKEAVQQRLQKQQQQGQERTRTLQRQLLRRRTDRRVDSVRRRVAAETDRVLQQLREETERQRRRVKQSLDAEVEQLRLRVEQQHHDHQSADEKSLRHAAVLRAEVEALQQKLRHVRSEILANRVVNKVMNRASTEGRPQAVAAATAEAAAAGGHIDEGLRSQLQTLRSKLREVEAEWSALAPQQEQDITERQQHIERELQQWRQNRDDARSRLHLIRTENSAQLDSIRLEHQTDMDRIRGKVQALLQRKVEAEAVLISELAELRGTSTQLQDTLEGLRDTKYGL